MVGLTLKYDQLCIKFLHTDSISIKLIHDNKSIKLVKVRCVLELTVRQNMDLFYQYRCNPHVLHFTELCTNTQNHNQFDTCIATCWLYTYVIIVKDFNSHFVVYQCVDERSQTLFLWSERSRVRFLPETQFYFDFLFACFQFVTAKPIQMKSSMAYIQINRCMKIEIIFF